MKQIVKLTLIFVMCFSFITTVNASEVNEEISIQEIDQILIEANTPQSVIDTLDDEMKKFIYSNSGEDIEYIETTKEDSEGINMRASGYQISSNDLELSVLAFKVQGQNQVDIYPSYEWKTMVKPNGKNYFAYSVTDSYSVVPGKRSNQAWYRNRTNQAWQEGATMAYTRSQITGYEHQGITLGKPAGAGYIRGNAYMRVDIDRSNPVKKIAIAYVHDTSTSSSFSYGVSYGIATIGVTPSSSNVGYLNNIFYLNY
ncbi:hypothetical protein [Turicibacter sanguinis]|uniref:Uncharacterized protein n=3 Tax=Turicibacter sanguinis TaxID=154288 RepID=A0A6G2CRY7_9FIRM|nr:hypothetical protein [Turicibacter sanguinis]KAB3587254.1 hypothetical protein GAY13_23330 [Phocaeicola vulgatus]MDB8545781.1 hypothetical protein [Turicibacter sanguinis]MTK70952.1 hypothetical protein [Turicibacter sanguinis]MTK82036.1 hypothetical protein [Turicibacter sanguinis]MTK84792.1 hypothetical protein [Turicibacter sanguinis]